MVLAAFRRRLDLLDDGGRRYQDAAFAAEFGRNLEYYTGFVFEIVAPELGPKSPVAGGGRYDSLLADVGAPVSGAGGRARASTPSGCWRCWAEQAA